MYKIENYVCLLHNYEFFCVFVYTNILSHFYLVCVTIMSHHFFTTDFTQSQTMQKIFETKISILFTILFHKTLHSH
jgi:hypothetical protein